MDRKNKSSPLPLVVLPQKQNPHRELKIVGPINSASTAVGSPSSSFELPHGWVVEQRPRVNGRFDKYYHEPGTGRKFRSLISIQKYLNGEINGSRESLNTSYERNMQIVPHIFRRCPSFSLPDDWVVVEKPRSNMNYAGVIDGLYIDPETGKRFQSLLSVERYLTKGKEYAATAKSLSLQDRLYVTDGKIYISKALKLGDHTPSKRSNSEKKPVSGVEVETSGPPGKVKWVLRPGGNIWSPSINDTLLPESVTHKWAEAFIGTLNDRS